MHSGAKVSQIDGTCADRPSTEAGTTLAATTDVSRSHHRSVRSDERESSGRLWPAHRERIVRMAFSSDGATHTLASGADHRPPGDGLGCGRRIPLARRLPRSPAAGVEKCLAFSPDGTTLWSGGDDPTPYSPGTCSARSTLVHRPPSAVNGPELLHRSSPGTWSSVRADGTWRFHPVRTIHFQINVWPRAHSAGRRQWGGGIF